MSLNSIYCSATCCLPCHESTLPLYLHSIYEISFIFVLFDFVLVFILSSANKESPYFIEDAS